MKKKKIIAFSLYGDNPKYTIGAIRNAELTSEIYFGWISRFYVGKTVPKNVVEKLKSINNIEVVIMDEKENWTSMFWRFLPCSDDDVEVMLSRDADSRLNNREADAVKEWLESDKDFHIMRDHFHHDFVILGGMWGCRTRVLRDMKKLISLHIRKFNYHGGDLDFLKEYIYPRIKDNCFIHDEFYDNKPFPTKRKGLEWVGQVFDENDKPVVSKELIKPLKRKIKMQALKEHLEMKSFSFVIYTIFININLIISFVKNYLLIIVTLLLKRKLNLKEILLKKKLNLKEFLLKKISSTFFP